MAALMAGDDDKIIAVCGALIDNDKAPKADRIKALIARAAAYDRKDRSTARSATMTLCCVSIRRWPICFNARGELWRKKGDRLHALADFGAAIRLEPGSRDGESQLQIAGAGDGAHRRADGGQQQAELQLRDRERRAVEKAICANPELANLDREINAVNTKVVREAGREQSARRPRHAARAGRISRPPQLPPSAGRLRPAEGDERPARPFDGAGEPILACLHPRTSRRAAAT